MLTNHAFNAMLKTLEEPPEHVKFILATTDPQKIPVTVLSRCLQFNLKQMPPGHIVGHLENILGQEHIEFEQPALRLLAQGAHGSMRDALSLTDQAIAYAAGKVSLDAVQGMLGALDQSYLIRLLDALAENDGKALLDVADEMAARSLSYKSALQDLGTLLHQLAIAQMVPAAVADDLPEREQVLRLANVFNKEEVQLFYQIAVHGRNELALAPDEYAGFSMTLLRMLAFRPVDGGVLTQSGGTGISPAPRPGNGMPSAPVRGTAPSTPAAPAIPVKTAAVNSASAQTQQNVSTQPMATVATAVPAAKPMSPAMAALAAARAASAKAGSTSKPAASKQENDVAPIVTPVVPVFPVASAMPAPVTVAKIAPVVAPLVAPVVAPAAEPAPVPTPAAARAPQEMEPVGMDDMPPPWDDDVWQASAFASAPASAPISSPAVTRNFQQNTVAESLAPVAVSEMPAVATATVPPVANVEPVAMDRTLWSGPVPALEWDGNWPVLAASLPVRGVAQQLAQQSELIHCKQDGNAFVFELRVPLSTLLSAGSIDKLAAALSERFGKNIRVESKIGAVELTANAKAVADREVRQQQAELAIQNDSFVQTLMREFGAAIVTGSVRPI